ncbi:MAG: histidine kinase, partial [Bacteroidetes bacterium]|nr:histidine kinase [Bacteroidota bacterium]
MFNIEWDSLFLLNKKQLLNLTTQFDYPVESPIKHMDYYKSTLVFSTTQNIYFCKNVLNILNHKPIHLRPIDISFSNINDIICNNDTLYIASDNGLTAIPFSTIQEVKIHRPIPYFISVFINDKQTNPDIDRISLKGKNRISFVFGSKSYSSGPVSFSYMLEGADKQWITGSGTNIVYQDLPPGEYSFKLKARKSTSPWSKPIVYHIIIKTTIWRHPLFFISLSIIFLVFIALLIIRRKNLQMKRREIEHQLITLEQKALQSMMNPHFIFNALGSIQNYLLQKKSSEAGLYLSQFARLIRQNLNAINAASINLDEEIDRLKNYLDLEKLRMEDKFEYNIEVDENVEADEIQIPSMIIQPFVENAIWHGIATIQEKGQINVKFRMQDEKSLAVTVEDNGI